MASRCEVEEVHLWEVFSSEFHHRGTASRSRWGLALVDDLVTAAEATAAIMKMEGSLHSCG